MNHAEGDVIKPRDCIIVASGNRKKDLPFIAKVTAIWEDPDDGNTNWAYFRIKLLDNTIVTANCT